jgi:hypothetical protein
MAWERLVFKAGAVTGTVAKGLKQTVGHLDPKLPDAFELCSNIRLTLAVIA